jgi:hypothetical protein
MTEKFPLSPDDIEDPVKIAEEIIPDEPYIAASTLFGLTVLALMNLIFEPNSTVIIVSILSGFMFWLISTAITPKLNHLFLTSYAGFIGILLNTNSGFIRDLFHLRFAIIYLLYIALGILYGYLAHKFGKETRDISQLIYFVFLTSFIIRGIILIRTGF